MFTGQGTLGGPKGGVSPFSLDFTLFLASKTPPGGEGGLSPTGGAGGLMMKVPAGGGEGGPTTGGPGHLLQ